MSDAILLISCPDKRGITATITNFIFKNNGNILHADQHTDNQTNTFFMRIEWSLEDFKIKWEKISQEFQSIAKPFQMTWELHFTDQKPRVAIFVSKYLHCLADLLFRYKAGQFNCEIPLVISNHATAEKMVKEAGIKFVEVPITKNNKAEQEKREIKLLQEAGVDLIVLARYHQILTKNFVDTFSNRIINIHHSFLPAFAGKSPYAQAYQRGVKIIGATSHYVTQTLDDGPIIEQDVARVSHRDSLDDLIRKGEDLERMVLNRTVRWALERKILMYNHKTVIFD